MKFPPFDKLPAFVLTLLAASLLVPAALAEEAAQQKKIRTVLKATIHIDVNEAQGVLDLLDVRHAVKPDQNIIVLRGDNEAVETALKVIDALDTPRPSIDLQVFVLAASKQSSSTEVPNELEATVDQLQAVFGYTGFRLLDTVYLNVREGRAGRVDGSLLLGEDSKRTGYQFGFQKATVVPEEGHNDIRIKGLEFVVPSTVAGSPHAALRTDVQIRAGQTGVIGSSTPQGVAGTLILVVRAKASPERMLPAE